MTTRASWWRRNRHDYAGSVVIPRPRSPIAAIPLLLWLLPQLLALIVATQRIALWARYPQPGELLSLHLVLTTQLAIASLLFPVLLRDRAAGLMVVVSGWPMALIAGSLSAAAMRTTLGAEGFVSLWLISLACCNAALSRSRMIDPAVALASLWTIGGGLLVYLRYEFTDEGLPLDAWLAGPIVALLRYLSGESSLRKPMIYFIALATGSLLSLSLRGAKGRIRARSPLHRATAPPDRSAT